MYVMLTWVGKQYINTSNTADYITEYVSTEQPYYYSEHVENSIWLIIN